MNGQYKIVMHLVNEGSSVHSQDKDCVRIIFVMSTLFCVKSLCYSIEYDAPLSLELEYAIRHSDR